MAKTCTVYLEVKANDEFIEATDLIIAPIGRHGNSTSLWLILQSIGVLTIQNGCFTRKSLGFLWEFNMMATDNHKFKMYIIYK